MNILYLLTEALKIGGAQSDIVKLGRYFVTQGHSVSIAAKEGVLSKELEMAGVEFNNINFHYRSLGAFLSALRQLKEILIQKKIDVIAPQSIRTSILAYFTLRNTSLGKKIPIVSTIHNIGSSFYLLLTGIILNIVSDFIVFESQQERDRLLRVGLRANKTKIIYSGVDLIRFAPKVKDNVLLDTLGLNHSFVLGTVARLSVEKNIHFLIDAVKKLRDKGMDIKLVLVGDGPLRKLLEEHAERLGLEKHILFVGMQEDIPNYLSIFDVFVLTSTRESFSLAVREAMAMGKAIISTNVGGAREMLDNGKCGILIRPKRLPMLVSSIEQLFKDKELRRKLGTASLEKAIHLFNQEDWLKNNESLYACEVKRAA